MKIIQEDSSTLEVDTLDHYHQEGTGYFTISIYNNLCKDSSHINLNEEEALKLRDRLNDWLVDYTNDTI